MTGPSEPTDGLERRLRRALESQAARSEPADDALDRILGAAEAAPTAQRSRRTPTLILAAAAVVLIALAAGALVLGDDDPDDLTTVDSPQSTATVTSSPTSTSSTEAAPPPTTMTAPGPTTGPPPTTPPATTSPTPPATLPGAGFGPVSGQGTTEPIDPALLVDVRVGSSAGRDRVVLEFLDGKLPDWSVSYVEPPIVQDGSGEPIEVAGEAFLLIRMESASGFVADGETFRPTYEGPARVPGVGTAQVLEVVRTGEFEGIYAWVIGLRTRVPFVVDTLTDPARLVIDVAAS